MISSNTGIQAQLAAMTAAAAANNDYKAVVFWFFNGGNDAHNLLVNLDDKAYPLYAAPRANICMKREEMLPLPDFGGVKLGLHPAMPRMAARIAAGNAAILANVGVLSVPTTREQFARGWGVPPTVQVPYNLFSHSDQQNCWATAMPNDPTAKTGWGGRLMDLASPFNGSSVCSPSISTSGNTDLLNGFDTRQYQIGSNGAAMINDDVPARRTARLTLLSQPRKHRLEQLYVDVMARSINSAIGVNTALAAAGDFATVFPADEAGNQAKIVARLIKARSGIGARRQTFFISLGGWDFHDRLRDQQKARLSVVDAAMDAFYQAMVEIGMDKQVVQATGSDFGRSLQQNGTNADGADHGWGGHHFIVGGGVKGGQMYGKWPQVALESPDDGGQGRLIPTTAVDEYVAALARWMSVPADAIPVALPNVVRFPNALSMF